jgi:hypothetical protein
MSNIRGRLTRLENNKPQASERTLDWGELANGVIRWTDGTVEPQELDANGVPVGRTTPCPYEARIAAEIAAGKAITQATTPAPEAP